MSKYQIVGVLKVRTPSGVKELQAGEMVTLPDDMAEPLLAQGRIKPVVASLDLDGSLVIPFGTDPRFHYWAGGQSIAETEKEMRQWKH